MGWGSPYALAHMLRVLHSINDRLGGKTGEDFEPIEAEVVHDRYFDALAAEVKMQQELEKRWQQRSNSR